MPTAASGPVASSYAVSTTCLRGQVGLSLTTSSASTPSAKRTLSGGARSSAHGTAYWQTIWFQVPWQDLPIAEELIAAKELFPIAPLGPGVAGVYILSSASATTARSRTLETRSYAISYAACFTPALSTTSFSPYKPALPT